jgi:virulence-associated protein VapD
VSQYEKLLRALMSGTKDRSVAFSDLQTVLEHLGFQCRIRGDHFIYTRDDVEEIINIQPLGSQAKPYQVKQVRSIILRYQLGGDLV